MYSGRNVDVVVSDRDESLGSLSPLARQRRVDDVVHKSPLSVPKYESCCFQLDRQFVTFVVQTIIGLCVLTFCGWQLASIEDCNRSTPYWGLMGTITGFFFRKLSIKGP